MKIPEIEHWAIITSKTIYIPGDERSRTNPGHGYPESTEESISYEAFTDYDEFERHVIARSKYSSNFRIMKVTPMKIETKVSIK